MSVKEDTIVADLVSTAPPAEIPGVADSLNLLVSGSSVVKRAAEDFVDEKGGVFSGKYVASKYNKDSSGKYIDYVNKKLFHIEVSSGKAIDIEPWTGSAEYPSYYESLVEKLEKYGQDYYPSSYAFTVIPNIDDDTSIVLIYGRRVNGENYYTGQWAAEYAVSPREVTGDIKLDIHYYEDGNVRLEYLETVNESLNGTVDGSSLVQAIERGENAATQKILTQFSDLNSRVFKNLRRLLPVTRSKINWGSAIGNYRLGSDAVNSQ